MQLYYIALMAERCVGVCLLADVRVIDSRSAHCPMDAAESVGSVGSQAKQKGGCDAKRRERERIHFY